MKLWKNFGACARCFCPLNWPFFRGGPFPRIEGLAPQFWERKASLMHSLLHSPLIAVRCQSVFPKNEGLDPQFWERPTFQWKVLDSIPEQDNTKFVVRQARSRLKLWICDGAEQLSTLLVAIKMRNLTFSDWRWSARWTVWEDGGQWDKVHLSISLLSIAR